MCVLFGMLDQGTQWEKERRCKDEKKSVYLEASNRLSKASKYEMG